MMASSIFADPALTVALALAAGMIAQVIARHLKIPGIVLLLASGVTLGPDVLGIIRPGTLGGSLHALVGFAVAVILFDGGMNLNLGRLRREARSIQQLVTVGALVTAAGGALAARLIMDWDWVLAILFGTLVMVTGPTVITPLLRRIKVQPRVATVLEAEGVLVDAIGAIFAVVALEVVISPAGSLGGGAWHFLSRLGFGALAGTAGGLLLAFLLRQQKVLPEGLESVFTLAFVVALFQASNAVMPESGILSVIMAGIVVGNARAHVVAELREFKEQLTVMLIGLLFVLLAADVRIAQVRSLGWAGLGTVLALMLVVRPLNVWIGTLGSELTLREKTFLSWLAPRGIVAAAVSSLFAQTLEAEGMPGGEELRAMVFLVIAVTVVVQGLTGGRVAGWLGVRRPSDTGFVILGANELGRALGKALRDGGEEVLFIDSNPDACQAAEEDGFRCLHGSGLDEQIQVRAELDIRAGCLGVTSNEEVNLLFARRVRKDYKVPRVWVALRREHVGISEETVARLGGHVLFGEPQDIGGWMQDLGRGLATVERWKRSGREIPPPADRVRRDLHDVLLPLAVLRGRKVFPVDGTVTFRRSDHLYVVIREGARTEALAWLRNESWEPVDELPALPPAPVAV
ncbi:MAG TPA: sodium:proton antiporter [Thermoanaerobaculia bacterium]|nr:sodium:proton antiporter [Thermoanaerobaculia bacterium]